MKNELIQKLLSFDVSLKVVDGNLKINAPKGVLTEGLISEIKSNKQYLINLLSSKLKIPKVGYRKSYPVTPSQKRIWVLSKFEGGNRAYNISSELEFEGFFDADIFLSAFKKLIKKHETLRTYFKENTKGDIRQHILPFKDVDFTINFQDVSDLDTSVIDAIISKHYSYTFDLSKGPLLRVEAIKISERKYVLLFNLHHIVGDGWSLEVLSKEVIEVYNALLHKKKVALDKLSLQYRDYAVWLESEEQQKRLKLSQEYWVEKLSGELPVLELPVSKKRPKIRTHNGASFDYQFSEKFSKSLKKFIKEQETSLFMGLMASINGLFHRYTNKIDFILGTVVAGRDHPDLVGQIGLYLNTLAIRTQFNDSLGFKDLLAIQKSTLTDAYKYQSYPFNVLVEQLNLKRDNSRSALFDVMVILQNQHDVFASDNSFLEDITVKPYKKGDKGISQFDISFSFIEKVEGLEVSITYNTDIYTEDFIARLLEHLENFVIEGIKNPTTAISLIDYLSTEEKNELLLDFNDTKVDYQKDKTILDSFREQVEKTPDHVAIVFEGKELTYKELDERSNQLASYFRLNGIKENTVVALCVDRSCEMIIGIMGVLKIGAAYLPLDPSYPIERLDYIIKDSHTELILTKEEIKKFIPKSKQILCFENEDIWNRDAINLPAIPSNTPAYIIYTSGTTGKPKGVAVSHQNLSNFFVGLNNQFELSKKIETWLAVTSMSFDISILELLWTLTRGSKVVIQPDRPVALTTMGEMDFSLFYFATQEEVEAENKYDLLLQGAAFADKNELKSIWIPERHFHSFGDQFPNPSVAAAAVAATTKNIMIRSGSVVLPLHDPVRVAEEWSMVDNLSNGRVELSIASGWHPNDFVLFPDDYKDRRQIMRNKITILKNLWQGKSLTRKNGIGEDHEFKIHPKPIQKHLKIWVTASRSVETFKYAGSIGANVLTRLLGQDIDDLKENIKAYREALQENGFDPNMGKVAVMLHTFISDDISYVRKTVETPFKNYLRNSVGLLKPLAAAANLDLENDLEAIVEMVFRRFYKTSCLFGTPVSCFTRVKELYDIGVNEIAGLLDFGIETDIVISNLKHFKSLNDLVHRSKEQYEFLLKRVNDQSTTLQLIEEHQVTHLQSTPSFIQELLVSDEGKESLQQIETLLIGGEALPQTLSNALIDLRKKSIFNMYGPTETTIWSTIKEITQKEAITIGKPIANTQIYVLDQRKQLCPVRVVGELYIGGDGVSMGYLGRDDINAEKFIDNPFIDSKTAHKIYKTGDLARWLSNGELECLGRIDSQVKLRGHRIELGEIENALKTNEGIRDAAVDLTINSSGEKELIAYIISGNQESINNLRTYLLKYLPQYMVPSRYMNVEEFPLTPNGKLDRKSLSLLGGDVLSSKVKYVAPRNKIEKKLVHIWQGILGVGKIGVMNDFFDLGGHSLNAVKILNAIKIEYGIEIKIDLFFNQSTIEFLALHIENLQSMNSFDTVTEKKKIVI